MNAFLDGLAVFVNHWQLLAGILVLTIVSYFVLMRMFGSDLSTSESISLGFSGWFVLSSILSLIWIFLGTQIFWIEILILLIFLFIPPRIRSDLKPAFSLNSFLFILAVIASLLLRSAFVSKALFPSYFDSPFHFNVAQNIVNHRAEWIFPWLAANYYHINYHFLVAFLAFASQTEVIQVMLILGQVFLAFIPFALFFPVKRLTGSDMAGWFTVALSAFGWYMPAHAVDWGKYPALMSLGLVIFVLSLALLISPTNTTKRQWMLYGLLGVGVLLSASTHSRSLILLGILFAGWVASVLWQRLSKRWQYIAFAFVLVGVVLQIVFIQQQEILALLFDPYLVKGLWVTILVLVLSIFAFVNYSRSTFVIILSVSLLLAGVFVPVGIVFPGREFMTLLDRPLVEMVLFLPLSLLGGLGLAGMHKWSWGRYVGLLAIMAVLVNAGFTYELYPSDCCVLVGNDDVVAMDWVANQLPVEARIGISSTEVRVNVANVVEGMAGGDAGAWITPLTGRTTFLIPYNMSFDQEAALSELCELQISHLYVGELGQAFDDAKLASRPEWYKPLLSMPKARVYEVIGCE